MRWWRKQSELDAEIEAHIRMAVADRVVRGEDAATARREVEREMGNLPLVKDVAREAWGWVWLERFLRDLKYALRQLRKSPGFAVTAVLVLALGIGANTAIFTLIYAIMLRTLPLQHPEELVRVTMHTPDPDDEAPMLNGSMLDAIDAGQTVFSGTCGWMQDGWSLVEGDSVRKISAGMITGRCLAMLGVSPIVGRPLTELDEREGNSQDIPALISYSFWKRHYQLDPNVVGRVLNPKPTLSLPWKLVIVGVLPRGFEGISRGFPVDVMTPITNADEQRHSTGSMNMMLLGRLKEGVNREQAEVQLRTIIGAWLLREKPGWGTNLQKRGIPVRFDLVPAAIGWSWMSGSYGKPLKILQGLTGLIFLAACSYLATLFLARGAARQQEIAVRTALGASRRRIAGQLLCEMLVLVCAGSLAGILLAYTAARALMRLVNANAMGEAASFDLSPGTMTLLFGAGLSLLAVLLAGLLPAWAVSGTGVLAGMKQGGGAVSGKLKMGRWLLPCQVALSLLVVVAAALLSTSLYRMLAQDAGFRMSETVFLSTDLPSSFEIRKLPVSVQLSRFRTLLERAAHAPGIESASLTQVLPLQGAMYLTQAESVLPSGEKRSTDEQAENEVAPGYFSTMGISMLAGRDFSWSDSGNAPKLCVLSKSTAEFFFPGEDPVGKILHIDGKKGSDTTVIGVVQDILANGFAQDKPRFLYKPVTQDDWLPQMEIVLRTRDTGAAVGSVRSILQQMSTDFHVTDTVTIHEAVNASMGKERLLAFLSNSFAALALLLSAIGLYGLMSYSAARRTTEIGIRMALGASRGRVVEMMLSEAAAMVLPGILLGILCAAAVSRMLRSLLYHTPALDPFAFGASIAALLLVSVLAGYLPARRAACVEPMEALRAE